MTFWGKIENGTLSIYNRTKVNKEIAILGDGIVEISLKHKKQRSLQQNKYLHCLLIPEFKNALNNVGYRIRTDEEAKMVLKSMFLTKDIPNEDTSAKAIHYVQDTSKLSKEEMMVLVEEVIQFAAENMNYRIPYPGEQTEFEL